jgi:hypothetical protein
MATISNTPRPGYVWDSTDNVWYPIGTGPHTHSDYITSSSAINPTIVDAKGDIIAATAADTVARLAVGSNDQVLTADSSTATGLKWATVAAGSNWSLLNSGGTALTSASTITVSGISGKDKIMILFTDTSSANAESLISIRLNSDTGNNYTTYGSRMVFTTSFNVDTFRTIARGTQSNIIMAKTSLAEASHVEGYLLLTGCNSSGVKMFHGVGSKSTNDYNGESNYLGGFYNSSSTISSISIISSTGNFDSGTVYVYTSA